MALRKWQYRDMDKYYETRRRQQARWRERTGSGKYVRREWTDHELELVRKHIMPDRELGKKIHRSVSAIWGQRRLMKQGLKTMNKDKDGVTDGRK